MVKELLTTNGYFKVALLLLVFLCPFFTEGYAQGAVTVKSFMDRESGGWSFKESDYAFSVESEDCQIQWNVIQWKDGGLTLEVRRHCARPFSEQAEIHKAILAEINSRWAISQFEYVSWGSFCRDSDWSWCIPIAEASLHSEQYIDYWKNYPNSELKSINSLFVELANETGAYQNLADLFGTFGVSLRLQSVEKVFTSKVREAPFYKELNPRQIKGNPRVMYDVGMSYFEILPEDGGKE